jgi:hypothetical protein
VNDEHTITGFTFPDNNVTGTKGLEDSAQGLAHARQLKALVLELERFDWISSTKDEGILVFDEPLKILALNQLNGVG